MQVRLTSKNTRLLRRFARIAGRTVPVQLNLIVSEALTRKKRKN